MINAPNNKSFGSGLTVINKVHNCIDYIIDDFFPLYQSYPPIENLTGYKNYYTIRIFSRIW